MKSLKMKKTIVIALLISLIALTACGNKDTNSMASEQGNSDVVVTESTASAGESVEEKEAVQSNDEVSMDSLLSHAETSAEDFKYYISDGYAWIDDYLGMDPIVVIPESIEGSPVKTISSLGNKGIQALKLSDSVESVGGFINDDDLQYLVFGANVKTVEDRAFLCCYNLKEIILNDSLETIGSMAFSSVGAEELVIPASVTEIGGSAFDMDGTQTIYVKAGSYAETYCMEAKENFERLIYVVE